MKRFTMLFGLAVLFLAPVVLADVPRLINTSGALKDGSGDPVADGNYGFRFRIYDDSTAGTVLWEESTSVQLTGGLFNHRLGQATPLPGNLFSTGTTRFLGIKVNSDTELAPRTRLVSVPYASQALRSDSAATTAVALDLTCTGCVGTGEIDATQVQRRVTGTAGAGQYITAINQDGSVVTGTDAGGTPSGWTDDGSTVRLSTNTDNVGIGTASPSTKLHVAAGSGEGLPGTVAGLLVNNNASAGDAAAVTIIAGSSGVASLALGNNAQAVKGGLTYNNSSNDLTIYGSGAAVAVLKGGSGNLGIGELSPVNQLDVAGGAAIGFAYAGTNVAPPNGLLVEGNVGIGTTSGFNTLDVEGRAAIGAGYAGTNGAPANGLIVEGAVGIGTVSPTAPLTIQATSGTDIQFASSGNNADITAASEFRIGTNTSNPLSLLTNNSTRLTIDGGGNTGIGTTSPTKKLEVAGSIKVGSTDTVFSSHISSNSSMSLITPTFGPFVRIYIQDTTGNIGIGTTTPQNKLDVEGGAAIGAAYSGTSTAPFNGLAVEGSVGIGTTNPFNKLDVEGAAVIGAAYSGTNTAPANGLLVEGNVGIGTGAFTGAELHVRAPAAGAADLRLDGDNGAGVWIQAVAGTAVGALGTVSNHSLNFYTNNTPRIYILNTGDVGIGTTTPQNKLDVEGGAVIGVTYSGTSAAPASGLLVQGNVGIGTTTPANKLDIEGGAAIGVTYSGTNVAPADGLIVQGNVGIGTNVPATRLQVSGGQLSVAGGTAAAPAFTFAGDLNTGIYSDLVNEIGISTLGTERMRINSLGKVGIGTTAPEQPLHVHKGSAGVFSAAANSVGIFENSTHGYVSILAPSGSDRGVLFGDEIDEADGGIVYIGASNRLDLRTNGNATRMAITSTGDVGIGTTAPAAKLQVVGTAGNATGVWSTVSDRRLKTDIEPMERALETIEQLQGVTFRWKDSQKDAQFGRVRGLIAQDVEKVIPEWIKTDPDGYKRIEPIGVDALLIEAIKELKTENENLKAKVSELDRLQTEMAKLTVLVEKLAAEKKEQDKKLGQLR